MAWRSANESPADVHTGDAVDYGIGLAMRFRRDHAFSHASSPRWSRFRFVVVL